MSRSQNTYLGILLVGVASVALASPALADPRDERIRSLEGKLDALVDELKELKAERATERAQVESQLIDLKRSATSQYTDIQKQRDDEVKVSLANGRPTLATADGKFSASLRALVQFDSAYYSQNNRALSGTDLSSGSVFRRARIGLDGKVFGDWSYSFVYDLGGAGVEGSGLSNFYVQYDGFKWAKLRTGAYATPEGLEDQTSANDLIFLERAAAPDLARSIAGADGRKNFLSVISSGENYYAALTWSGAKAGDAAVFDGQQAAVGYLASRVYHDADTNVVVAANGTYVFKVADTAAGRAGPSAITYQARLESAVDGTRLISAGAINASKAAVWGVETAANWKNLYAQAGYFGFSIDRRASALPDPNFDGWYVQGTWVLTGESRRYNTGSATWGAPRPDKPFSLKNNGIGAWELAARYSVLDLDYRPGLLGSTLVASTGGIRGGKQKTFTAGLNWYPNNAVRLLFNYERADIARLATTAPFRNIGQNVDIITARAQLAF
jgi:phosphate-selective porin OprO/OprP